MAKSFANYIASCLQISWRGREAQRRNLHCQKRPTFEAIADLQLTWRSTRTCSWLPRKLWWMRYQIPVRFCSFLGLATLPWSKPLLGTSTKRLQSSKERRSLNAKCSSQKGRTLSLCDSLRLGATSRRKTSKSSKRSLNMLPICSTLNWRKSRPTNGKPLTLCSLVMCLSTKLYYRGPWDVQATMESLWRVWHRISSPNQMPFGSAAVKTRLMRATLQEHAKRPMGHQWHGEEVEVMTLDINAVTMKFRRRVGHFGEFQHSMDQALLKNGLNSKVGNSNPSLSHREIEMDLGKSLELAMKSRVHMRFRLTLTARSDDCQLFLGKPVEKFMKMYSQSQLAQDGSVSILRMILLDQHKSLMPRCLTVQQKMKPTNQLKSNRLPKRRRKQQDSEEDKLDLKGPTFEPLNWEEQEIADGEVLHFSLLHSIQVAATLLTVLWRSFLRLARPWGVKPFIIYVKQTKNGKLHGRLTMLGTTSLKAAHLQRTSKPLSAKSYIVNIVGFSTTGSWQLL